MPWALEDALNSMLGTLKLNCYVHFVDKDFILVACDTSCLLVGADNMYNLTLDHAPSPVIYLFIDDVPHCWY